MAKVASIRTEILDTVYNALSDIIYHNIPTNGNRKRTVNLDLVKSVVAEVKPYWELYCQSAKIEQDIYAVENMGPDERDRFVRVRWWMELLEERLVEDPA